MFFTCLLLFPFHYPTRIFYGTVLHGEFRRNQCPSFLKGGETSSVLKRYTSFQDRSNITTILILQCLKLLLIDPLKLNPTLLFGLMSMDLLFYVSLYHREVVSVTVTPTPNVYVCLCVCVLCTCA